MSKKLNEQLWAVTKEYARQFGEIIGMEPEHCVGDCPSDMWCFGDTMFFSLEEMQQVVDRLPEYINKYGDKATVGYEIHDWVNWWLDDMSEHREARLMELVEARVTRQLRPNISLQAWLDGCPRTERDPWGGPDGELMWLKNAAATVSTLIGTYRENRTLGNVLVNLNARIEPLEKAKSERDSEEFERMMKKFDHELNELNELGDGEQQNLY